MIIWFVVLLLLVVMGVCRGAGMSSDYERSLEEDRW